MENKERKRRSYSNQIAYSRGEETANIITHALGALLSVIASVFMIVKVSYSGSPPVKGNALAIVSICLYSFCLIEMYVMSALYHAQPLGKTRRAVFRRFDHCGVALLIAGTYAPYMLVGLSILGAQTSFANFVWGIVIASVVLGMAVLVIVFNAINVQKFRVFSLIAYVVMGWACVIRLPALYSAMGTGAFWFLLSGGIVYTAGIIFYRIKKIPWHHFIWHLFVLAGSALHFISIYCFIL